MALAQRGDIRLFGLNYKDEPADALRWLEFYDNPYQVTGIDLEGRTGIDFGVYGLPETFVIDRHGKIRYKHVGPLSERQIEQTVLPLIERLQQWGWRPGVVSRGYGRSEERIGRHLAHPGLTYASAPVIDLQCEAPHHLQLDGDPVSWPTAVSAWRFSIAPGSLEVATGCS